MGSEQDSIEQAVASRRERLLALRAAQQLSNATDPQPEPNENGDEDQEPEEQENPSMNKEVMLPKFEDPIPVAPPPEPKAKERTRMASDNSNRVGLVISTTDSIRVFLSRASNDTTLSDGLRQTSSDLLLRSEIPYTSLRALWMASNPSTRPDLTRLFSGTRFVLSSPKPREKSEELKARLKKLEDLAERKAYQELVKDIAPPKDVVEPFSTYKDQLGFGLHVVVTMFTGYLVGYAAFRALFNHSPAMNAAGGILGLVGAMLVETFLFIIRSSNADSNKTRKFSQKPRPSFSSTSSLKKNQ